MKTLLVWILALFIQRGLMAADSTGPFAEMKLTNGTVFRNVTVVRYDRELVVLKSTAGTGPLRYEMITEPLRSKILADRDAFLAAKNSPAQQTQRRITGQVFVTTLGAGAYKFSGAAVKAYPLSIYDMAASAQPSYLPSNYRRLSPISQRTAEIDAWIEALKDQQPVGFALTDSNGDFEIKVPSDIPVFLLCGTFRLAGGYKEWNLWVVKPSEDRLFLSGSNQWEQP